jgi:hypothetical protein
MHLSHTITLYKTWLAAAPDAVDVAFVDAAYDMCERNYNAGGDTIVECFTPEEILSRFKTLPEIREFCGLKVEQALNARCGEDSDPEVGRMERFDQGWEGLES